MSRQVLFPFYIPNKFVIPTGVDLRFGSGSPKSSFVHWDRTVPGFPTPPLSPRDTSPPLCHLDRSVLGFPASQLSITATYAALCGERRKTFTDHATLDRKSGGAQWRDLLYPAGTLDLFSREIRGSGVGSVRNSPMPVGLANTAASRLSGRPPSRRRGDHSHVKRTSGRTSNPRRSSATRRYQCTKEPKLAAANFGRRAHRRRSTHRGR